MPRQLVGRHVTHDRIAVQRLCKTAGQRLPGGRAPFAMPRPFTGGAAVWPRPQRKAQAQRRIRRRKPVPVVAPAGFGAAGAFFAPGLRAPGAIPSPLTSGSGLAGSAGASGSALGAAAAGAAGAAFLAPGRRAPAAMPRPLTSGSGLAGSAGAGASAAWVRRARPSSRRDAWRPRRYRAPWPAVLLRRVLRRRVLRRRGPPTSWRQGASRRLRYPDRSPAWISVAVAACAAGSGLASGSALAGARRCRRRLDAGGALLGFLCGRALLGQCDRARVQ